MADINQFVLASVEEYLVKSGMTPTRFGIEVCNDRNLVFQLRGNPRYGPRRNPTLKTVNAVLSYIDKKVEIVATPNAA